MYTTCVTIESHYILGHRPVIVKRALIGSKGGWILSTIFMLKMLRDWSIIKLRESIHICYMYIIAACFETAYHCFC